MLVSTIITEKKEGSKGRGEGKKKTKGVTVSWGRWVWLCELHDQIWGSIIKLQHKITFIIVHNYNPNSQASDAGVLWGLTQPTPQCIISTIVATQITLYWQWQSLSHILHLDVTKAKFCDIWPKDYCLTVKKALSTQ